MGDENLVLYLLALCGWIGVAQSGVLYQFDVTTVATKGGTPGSNPFSFSFTAPTFVVNGDTPPFTPFAVTDGTQIWTMINDLRDHNRAQQHGSGQHCDLYYREMETAPEDAP